MTSLLVMILKGLGGLCILGVIVLGGMYYFESHHQLQNYDDFVGQNLSQSSSTKYGAQNRSEHLGYLSTYNHQDGKIRFIDRGQKNSPVIVLVHGTPTNSWLYRKMIPLLVTHGYRVIVPDMLGFGASAMEMDPAALTTNKQATRLIALLDSLEIDEFAIAGHDQGSLRVWETITTIPERISHLIIFNSIGDRDGFHPPAGFGKPSYTTKFTSRAMGSKSLGRIFAYGAMLGGLKNKTYATTEMIDGYLFPLFHGMSGSYYVFITRFDGLESQLKAYQLQFSKLNIPTMVVWGKHDKILVGEEQIPVLKKLFNIKDKNIHLLDDAAHFIQEEKSEKIVSLMKDFID